MSEKEHGEYVRCVRAAMKENPRLTIVILEEGHGIPQTLVKLPGSF